MQKRPRQMQFRQSAPPLFVAALLLVLLALPITQVAKFFAATIIGVYAIAAIGASIFAARKDRWQLLPLLPFAFTVLHLAYGAGFLIGLVRFWNRWRANARQPKSMTAIPDVDKY